MENPKNFSDRLVLAMGPTPEEIHRALINSGRDLGKQNLNLVLADFHMSDFNKGTDLFTCLKTPLESRMKISVRSIFTDKIAKLLMECHSIAGSSEELYLQREINKHPHRADLKLRLMKLQKGQSNTPIKRKSKKKRK